MDKTVKCNHCKKTKSNTDKIWQVLIVSGDGTEVCVPCCTEECAKETQHQNMLLHSKRISLVQDQKIQTSTVNEFSED